jgi:hypothetical protein
LLLFAGLAVVVTGLCVAWSGDDRPGFVVVFFGASLVITALGGAIMARSS